MPKLIDALVLASLPRYEPLKIESPPKPFGCVICGASQEAYAYRVRLPQKAGVACTGCATDRGFEVR